jgi:hydroperoxide lyase
MRDSAVFQDPESFVPTRFMGDKGKELLNYVYWSNGPQTSSPTSENKQCAAKDYVVWTACLFIAEVFKRYDDFECDESSTAITKLEKAKN